MLIGGLNVDIGGFTGCVIVGAAIGVGCAIVGTVGACAIGATGLTGGIGFISFTAGVSGTGCGMLAGNPVAMGCGILGLYPVGAAGCAGVNDVAAGWAGVNDVAGVKEDTGVNDGACDGCGFALRILDRENAFWFAATAGAGLLAWIPVT
jgi:hypothetical protein